MGMIIKSKKTEGRNMIKYLNGILTEVDVDNIVVEVNGIGYGINVPTTVIANIREIGSKIKIYTYMNVKEDEMSLFGFLTKDEIDIFKRIISVSGIGPKGGLAILSTLSADDLRFAVLSDDAKAIAKAPGIGVKTASKLILELKDKFNLKDAFEKKSAMPNQLSFDNINGGEIQDAIDALVALGYSSTDALKAVRSLDVAMNENSGSIIKRALKIIGSV